MKSKKLSEQIVKTFKSNGFVLSEPDILLDSEYIIQRSGENKLKKQMEYANKIKSPAVILFGEDEIKSKKPTLRNLNSGNEKSIEIKEIVNEIKKII